MNCGHAPTKSQGCEKRVNNNPKNISGLLARTSKKNFDISFLDMAEPYSCWGILVFMVWIFVGFEVLITSVQMYIKNHNILNINVFKCHFKATFSKI